MIATYYCSSPGKLADGTRFNSCYFTAAPRYFKLGQTLRLYCPLSKRYVSVKVRDYGPRNMRHLDLSQSAFKHLVGPKYRVIGKVTVKIL